MLEGQTAELNKVGGFKLGALVPCCSSARLRFVNPDQNIGLAPESICRKNQVASAGLNCFASTKKRSEAERKDARFFQPAPQQTGTKDGNQNGCRHGRMMNIRFFGKPCVSEVPGSLELFPQRRPQRSQSVYGLSVMPIGSA